jgi:hypothetical protein
MLTLLTFFRFRFFKVLMPPTIKTQTKWLVITVHFAEYLPKLDSASALAVVTGSTGGIDAYYVVQVVTPQRRI